MLRLVDPKATHIVTILDTDFRMRSLSVREKFKTIEALRTLQASVSSYDEIIEILCSAIYAISGSENVKDILNQVESLDDILGIINGVVEYCSFKEEEAKNSDSSSDTSTPEPTGDVKNAESRVKTVHASLKEERL